MAVATAAALSVPLFPASQRQPGDGHHEPGIEQEERRPHVGEDPHQLAEIHRVLDDRIGDVAVLMTAGREGLEGLDIGVAIDDPARHHRFGFREFLGVARDERHGDGEQDRIEQQPEPDRHQQDEIELGQHDHRNDHEHHGVPGRVDAEVDGSFQRLAGLDDLVGDAAGKIVLEEGPALMDDVPMALPAHDGDEVGNDGVVANQGIEQEGQRADQHDDKDHPQQGLAVLIEDFAGIGGGQHAHDEADEDRHQRVGKRADGHEHDADYECRTELADEIADEGSKAQGRLPVFGESYGRVQIVEIGDDAVEH